MTSFNERESAEWTQGVEQENARLLVTVDKALADGAARGFCEPPGENLDAILQAGQEAKDKLVLVNGKIYDDRRAIIFSEYDFALKILVRVMTLAMELYRVEIFDALEIEQTQVQAAFRKGQADVKRLDSDTELRMVAIIRDKATAQAQIAALKAQLVQAQTNDLPYEAALLAAQLQTAEMKLQIIASIWQIIAAQKVELVADQAKVAALQDLLVAERNLVAVQQGVLPYEQALLLAQLATAVMRLQEIPPINQEIAAEKVEIAADYDKLAADQAKLAAQRVLVTDQEATVPYESVLVAAGLQTAEMKLQEIPAIDAEIAAEKVEVAADQAKVMALQNLLTADQALVAIKLAMVPYYIQKADAELQLAAAETANLPIQTALVNLGYGRLEVEVVKEYVDHLLRVAEENKKLVDANLVTAEEANRLIRTQNEETLAAYRNQIQAELLAKKLTLDEEEVLYGLQTPLARETIRVNNEVGLENYDRTLLTEKLTSLLTNLQARAQSEAAQIAASVVQRFNRETTSLVEKTIQAGSFVVA
ncbi:MAG: hypothetical protein ABSG90_11625 [Dehalococcoidia bacterium]|jgi:hypothetical protein